VAIFSGHGHSHFPVLDEECRLVGIIARSDALRGLFACISEAAGGDGVLPEPGALSVQV